MPDQPVPPIPTATTPRAQVPAAYQWRITDLFQDDAAWTAALAEVKPLIQSLKGLAKGWTASLKALLAFMEAWTEVNRRVDLLNAYPTIQLLVDMNNSTYISLQGEIQGVQSALGAQLAFMNPELIKLGQAQVEAYLKAEPGLLPYRAMFMNILAGKGHALSAKVGAVLSMAYEVTQAPSAAYTSLCNEVDLASPQVTLSTGQTFAVSNANYETFVGLPIQADRLLWEKASQDHTQQYATTFATLLDAAIRLDWFNAKVRNFPTSLEAMMAPLGLPTPVYGQLTATVKANLAPLYRYLNLCKKILGVPVLHDADTSCPLAPTAVTTFSFDQAQAIVLKASACLGPDYVQGLNEASIREGVVVMTPRAFLDGWQEGR